MDNLKTINPDFIPLEIARKEKGLTINILCYMAGVSVDTYYKAKRDEVDIGTNRLKSLYRVVGLTYIDVK